MKNQLLIRIASILFILSVFTTVIILAKDFLIPVAVSFFFAYLLYPVVWFFEKKGLNRALAILLVILFALFIMGTIGLFLSVKLSNMEINLPEIKEQVDTKVDSLLHVLENKLGLNANTLEQYMSKSSENLFSSWETRLGDFFTATTTTIFQIGILPVFTFFFLFYRTKTAWFILKLVKRKNKAKTLHILREISSVTTKYVGGVMLVVLALAFLNTIGLYLIGIPHSLIFGILSALLNLIPYFGTLIGGMIPILFVLFTYADPFQTIFQIIIMFTIVQFIENNLLTPNIVGNNIKINPLAIIFSLLLANLVWGIAGMLIVVPCLAILKIVMRNIEDMKPFAFLISDKGVDRYRIKFKWIKTMFRKKKTS